MLSPTDFLTELYVLIDEWDKTRPLAPLRPGPRPELARSEVLTLALFSQWSGFRSERQFWRYASCHLRPLFPQLPSRVQFLRAVHRIAPVLAHLAVHLGQALVPTECPFEILDATGIETRDARRRGIGWLPGIAAKGKCTREGWYVGLRLLVCVTPEGAITGFGIGSGNTNERKLAETFFAQRAATSSDLPSIGHPVTSWYLTDGGFTGLRWERHWLVDYGAMVICPPERTHRRAWAWEDRRWFAGKRQIVETTTEKLLSMFRMATDRWHTLTGALAWTAAKIAACNAAMVLNRHHGRPLLAFADLIDW
jgi:hypothetical protein